MMATIEERELIINALEALREATSIGIQRLIEVTYDKNIKLQTISGVLNTSDRAKILKASTNGKLALWEYSNGENDG